MAFKVGAFRSEQGFLAAVRRFPQAELAIRRLMNHSETFCDMCEELAEAELALSRVDEVAAALREARRTEWQELVDRLAEEIDAALEGRSTLTKLRSGPVLPR